MRSLKYSCKNVFNAVTVILDTHSDARYQFQESFQH